MEESVPTTSEAPAGHSDFDVFQWANAVEEIKNNVSVESALF